MLDRLRSGDVVPSLPALPQLRSIGVGHSMGSLLTVYQQARHHDHVALVLLGFGDRGLPSHLEERELRYSDDPDGLIDALEDLARQRFGNPLPVMPRGSSNLLVEHPLPDPVREALVAARAPQLAVAGLSSMIPGSSRNELAKLDVPVRVAVGDGDITGPPEAVRELLPPAAKLSVYVLDASGHNHNVAPTRERLWNHVIDWIDAVARAAGRIARKA